MILASCGDKSTEEKPDNQQNSSFIWSVKSLNKMNWQEANDYCQNLTEREQRDWHLPTIEEVRDLIQSCPGTITSGTCSVSETCADTDCLDENCQACSPESDGSYSRLGDINQLWSATSVSNNDSSAWFVDFSNAGIYQDGKENYRYVRCARILKGAERKRDCQELPDKAVWNKVSEITQTWNGEEWIPATTAGYGEEASSAECRFKCAENYEWDGAACANAKRRAECSGLPENAEWNTVSSITQTWNDEEWIPATTASYNEEASDKECRFKCTENHEWDGAACANAKRRAECTGLPENAEWNTVSSITQSWTGTDWIPSTTGIYDANPSSTECRFKCNENYSWKNSKCVADTRTANCTGLPENAEWNTASSITQTWNGEEWVPATEGSFSSSKSTTQCVFKCERYYNWENSACVSACNNEPCAGVENSTGQCSATNWNEYSCGCESGYVWNNQKCMQQPSLGNICTNQTACYGLSFEIACPESGSNYFGQDAQYADSGVCLSQNFSLKTVSGEKVVEDKNTGLMWQQAIPALTYTREEAENYCGNLVYAEYTDWRLPTPHELLSIVDNSQFGPAADSEYFPNIPSDSRFWTSAKYVKNTDRSWIVDSSYGGVDLSEISSYYVRCVRGEKTLPASVFSTATVNGDKIVTETKSGLIWQRGYKTDQNWREALYYCENLTYAGYSDWRLPNKNELASLVNYEKNNFTDFPSMPESSFWSSTSMTLASESDAWGVNFYYGRISALGKDYFYLSVRCVRSNN